MRDEIAASNGQSKYNIVERFMGNEISIDTAGTSDGNNKLKMLSTIQTNFTIVDCRILVQSISPRASHSIDNLLQLISVIDTTGAPSYALYIVLLLQE